MHELPPKHVEDAVVAAVMTDLEPPFRLVHAKIGTAAVAGCILSLLTCGQFGIGVTSWADALNHAMHTYMNPVGCAVICGVLFAVFPITVLRFLFTTPLQFRVLIRRHQLALLAWFAGIGGTLAWYGEHGSSIVEVGAWILAAIVAANVCALAMNALFRDWQPPQLFKSQTL